MKKLRVPTLGRILILCICIIFVVLITSALLLVDDLVRGNSPTQVFTIADVQAGLSHAPNKWYGKTILVRAPEVGLRPGCGGRGSQCLILMDLHGTYRAMGRTGPRTYQEIDAPRILVVRYAGTGSGGYRGADHLVTAITSYLSRLPLVGRIITTSYMQQDDSVIKIHLRKPSNCSIATQLCPCGSTV